MLTTCFHAGFLLRLDCLCGLLVRVSGYRSKGPGSIPDASRFSEKQWVWNGVHSASWGQLRSYLEEIVAAPVKKIETNDRGGSVMLTTQHPLYAKVGTSSPTIGGRSVGIVRCRTEATEFFPCSAYFFDPEDGGDMFLRNVGRHSTDYTELILKDGTLHNHRCENLKSYIAVSSVFNLTHHYLSPQQTYSQ
jgi:hypothetical protein